jgi:hypothetical protein
MQVPLLLQLDHMPHLGLDQGGQLGGRQRPHPRRGPGMPVEDPASRLRPQQETVDPEQES